MTRINEELDTVVIPNRGMIEKCETKWDEEADWDSFRSMAPFLTVP